MADTPVMKIVPPYTPELLPEVQGLINVFLRSLSDPSVLELGGGWSTIWFAGLTGNVHSVEHNMDWWREILRVIHGMDFIGNVRVEPIHASRIDKYVGRSEDLDGEYDLILIDCVDEARLPSLFASLTRLSPGGWLVLDDSHWPMFEGVEAVMKNLGFNSRTIKGNHTRKTGEVCFHQTTIFSKGPL